MSPRQRRLHSDFEKIKDEFTNHPYIKVEYEDTQSVPERYFVSFNIKGLKLSPDSTKDNRIILISREHKIEIYLHIDYPRMKPVANILTPIFHPNFRTASPHDICIGDYWASGETLVDIIYQIGEMIMYQNYNVESPLNGPAALWAKKNIERFPVDNTNIRRGDMKEEVNEIEIDLR